MHHNNNNMIDLVTHASRTNITSSSTITVGKHNRHNHSNAPIPRRLEPINFNNRLINPTKALFRDTPCITCFHRVKKKKQIIG